VPEDSEEETKAANRAVSFTITLDGASKLSPTSSSVPSQKRRVVDTRAGEASGAVDDDDEEEESALVLTAGDIDGLPTFDGTPLAPQTNPNHSSFTTNQQAVALTWLTTPGIKRRGLDSGPGQIEA
jgi:hypothetical protein